ncbi:MAG: ferrous iron transport protein [Pseudomonadota bacterium]|jgi:ferrous iron transport protein B
MSQDALPVIALVGVPNCGKTALFNRLTGSRQKVANYAGVTVERKEGQCNDARRGRRYRVLDLPGTYSLAATTLDEAITRDAVLGRLSGEARPQLVVNVIDATNLKLGLRLTLELRRLGLPMVVVLNLSDLAARRGMKVDSDRLAAQLGCPVVESVAVRHGGEQGLLEWLAAQPQAALQRPAQLPPWQTPTRETIESTQRDVRRVLANVGYREPLRLRALERLDALVLHPVAGPLLLLLVLFLIFQAVFSWAAWPMDLIDGSVARLGGWISSIMPEGLLRSLLVDGVVAGVGGVLVFLPQILVLFLFILLLEDSGYLPRAAFLLDRLMGHVGLSGRSFIPLLSSFACAIPGIMAARTIPNLRDRLATILLAPLMTCSARLPVYALVIAAFIPSRDLGPFNLQGLVLFALYVAGVLGAVAVALVMKRFTLRSSYHPLLMELPEYRWPSLNNLLVGLWERAYIFLARVGGIILALTILLWFLATFPAPPPGATGPAIEYSFAGMLGRTLEFVFAPIGFNWQISVALVPGMAAREVAVSALGTVYALSATDETLDATLAPLIAADWSMATALSLLAWFVFAPQCLSTLATVRRETNSWRYPVVMAAYLFALAYAAAFVTYHVAVALGAG